MIFLAILEAVYGLIQALIPSLGVLWVDYIQVGLGNSRGTFINRNHFAGFIEMVWPLALGYALALGHRGKEISLRKLLASDRLNKQILMVLGIVVMILALLLSRSRAGIMGACIGFLTFSLLSRSPDKRLTLGFWIVSGAVVSLILLYGLKIGFDPLKFKLRFNPYAREAFCEFANGFAAADRGLIKYFLKDGVAHNDIIGSQFVNEGRITTINAAKPLFSKCF